MELAPMFMDQRWNILKHLSKQSLSPLQLANMTSTTIANISQQLRLLEAANLVKKKRVPNRDKGQPRTLFSLTEDYAYIVSLMNEFADKKLIKLTNSQKRLLKILSIDDAPQRDKVENIYFRIHRYLDRIQAIAIDLTSNATVVIVTSDKELKRKLDEIEGVKTFTVPKLKEYLKSHGNEHIITLDDPHHLFKEASGAGKDTGRKVAA
jgi:DNA-binding transcriptional regulator GbsR (MarR family)